MTGLLATGKSVVFKSGKDAREVGQLLLAVMEDMLERERQKRRGV